jgi:glycosyltransferase involved in cell wall biosynthesis
MSTGQSSVTVTVIIPTYNRAQVVGRAIRSVLEQNYHDFEILVVDDASTDATAEIVGSFDDRRIHYIRHEINRGGSAARNTAIRASRGEYLAFLDSDDEWLPQKLEKQLELFRTDPEKVGIVHTGGLIVDSHPQQRVRTPVHRGYIFRDQLLSNKCGSTSLNMIRRDALAVAPGFDEELPAMQDHDFFLRISKHFLVDFVPDPLAKIYDGRDDVRITLNRPGKLQSREYFFRKHHQDLEKEGLTHVFLRDTARLYQSLLGDTRTARRLYWRSLKLNPLSLPSYPRLLTTLLPRSFFHFMARWKRELVFGLQRLKQANRGT